ncbi:MAG: hypothetical protein ACSLFE_03750 [Gemmatimonadaceae bacterium]
MTASPVSVVTPVPPRNVLDRYTEDVVNEALSQRRLHSTSLPHITAAVENAKSTVELEKVLDAVEQLRGVLSAEGPVPQYSSRRFVRLRLDWPELWDALRKISRA